MKKIITSCLVCQSEELTNFCRSDAYDYKKCSSCGHIFLSNPPSENEMEEYYQYEEKRSKEEVKRVSPLLFLFVTNKALLRFAQCWGSLINNQKLFVFLASILIPFSIIIAYVSSLLKRGDTIRVVAACK